MKIVLIVLAILVIGYLIFILWLKRLSKWEAKGLQAYRMGIFIKLKTDYESLGINNPEYMALAVLNELLCLNADKPELLEYIETNKEELEQQVYLAYVDEQMGKAISKAIYYRAIEAERNHEDVDIRAKILSAIIRYEEYGYKVKPRRSILSAFIDPPIFYMGALDFLGKIDKYKELFEQSSTE